MVSSFGYYAMRIGDQNSLQEQKCHTFSYGTPNRRGFKIFSGKNGKIISNSGTCNLGSASFGSLKPVEKKIMD